LDQCVAQDQCYGYKIPPILGGKYALENVSPTNLCVHYSLLADIWRRTKDLPDGTRIKAVVIDGA